MGRKYVIETGFVAATVAQDLLELLVPADAVMIVHSIQIDQSTDEAASEAEKLTVFLKRGIGATSGSGGSTATPAKLETGDAAAGITAETNNTTQATAGGGSLGTVQSWVWDVLAGFEQTFTPELRPIFSPAERAVLAIEAPADSLTINAKMVVEELGG